MRITIIHIFLIAALTATVHAETKCYAVEHPDHDEALCVGDDKKGADKSAPPKITPAENGVQQPTRPVQENAASTAVPGRVDNKTASEKPALQSGGLGSDTAAHLARRKALAIKNSLKLKDLNSQPKPGTEHILK